MIEIRIHGRGGQGAVVASRALAAAAFRAGWYVQSYPDFGVERRGAPVVAFARIAEPGDVHFVRQDITEPHHVLILDSTLLTAAAVIGGLRPGGWVVVNTPDPPDRLGLPSACRVASVDASAIALEHGLGTPAQPVVNTAILGAFARATGVIELEHLLAAIRAEVPVKADENVAAAVAAYEGVVVGVAA
jgi:pyruvate ferredoxin oxidoreductase gamma subunit/2-oxoisovalerate ferredoxin oxidoreductase gamma subunit